MKIFFHHDRRSHEIDVEKRRLYFNNSGPGLNPLPEQVPTVPNGRERLRLRNINEPPDAVDAGRRAQVEANQIARKQEIALRMANADLATLQRLANPDNNRLISTERSMEHTAARQELRNRGEELPKGTAQSNAANRQRNAPRGNARLARNRQQQNTPQLDPVQNEADAQASILNDGAGGTVDWSTLSPEERTTRTHDVQARFGVSVDPDTGVVTSPTDVTEANFNRIGGAVGKMGTAFGKWMEKFSGLMGTISGQPVAPNVAPIGPVSNPAETSVKAKLQTTGYAALKPSLEADVQTATADIQRISANLAAAAPVDKPTIQAQLDAANTKKATAVAELAALEKLKTIAEKLAKDMDVKVQKLKQLMPTLKPAPNNSFKDLPAKIADITISRSDELQVQIKDPNGGVSDFHTELLDVMSKQQSDASFAIDGNENIKNPAAFTSMLNDALVKAKKEQA